MSETETIWEAVRETVFSAEMISSVVAIVIGLVIWLAVRKLYRTYADKKRQEEKQAGAKNPVVRTPALTAYRIFEYILLTLVVVVVLQINGINVSSLIAGLGVVGIIVGYSLQDIIKDAIMGMHIQTDRFFQVGDVVKIGDLEGIVIDFNMRTTKILSSLDGSTVSICNRNIDQAARVSAFNYIDVPLSYEADAEKVREVLRKLCVKIGELEGVDRAEFHGTSGFEDSAITYRVNFYCSPANRFEMKRQALGVLQDGLKDAGLEIPYNQLDVHTS